MGAKLLSRIIMVLVVGMGLAFGLCGRMEGRRQAGRDAFMARQNESWDRVYNRPHHLSAELVVCVAGTAFLVAAYELAAAGLYRVLRKVGSDTKDVS
jgi:hypothetical protein